MPDLDVSDLELRAQAGVWLARLRAEDRSQADEAGFCDWLTENPRHKNAFEAATLAWEAVGAVNIERSGIRNGRVVHDAPVARRLALATGVAVVAGVAGAGLLSVLDGWTNYMTPTGETRTVALEDGSRILLDTDTVLRARLGPNRRNIRLLRGRAHFAVAKDPTRPFIVAAGTREIIALGTAFDVAKRYETTTVLLQAGRVSVRSRKGTSIENLADLSSPGVRLTVSDTGRATQDYPDMQRMTAWQDGRVIFDGNTLADAVAEINRYNHRQIVLGADSLKSLRLSGVYVSGDPQAFSTSIATLFDLAVEEGAARTVLRPTGGAVAIVGHGWARAE